MHRRRYVELGPVGHDCRRCRVVGIQVNEARNFIAVVTGRKGQGKSHVLELYARQFPRRIVLDFTGEHRADVPPALVAWSLADAVRILQHVAKHRRWTVVLELHPRYVPRLLRVIMPMGAATGYSVAVGGVAIVCGEINEIAPNHQGIADEVAAMFSRGRHHWLSVLAAARTSTEINKIVTSQADVICAFRQHQEADVRRIAELMGPRAVPALHDLGRYEYLRYFVDYGRLEHVRADGAATLIP